MVDLIFCFKMKQCGVRNMVQKGFIVNICSLRDIKNFCKKLTHFPRIFLPGREEVRIMSTQGCRGKLFYRQFFEKKFFFNIIYDYSGVDMCFHF